MRLAPIFVPRIWPIEVERTIAFGSRPASAASFRIAATRGAITFLEGPDMNTHSAWRAAKARPAGEVPA